MLKTSLLRGLYLVLGQCVVPAAYVAFAALALAPAPLAHAQATPSASRLGDPQVGAGFSFGNSNFFTPELGGNGEKLLGFDLYSTLDLKHHIGVELNFRQTHPTYGESVYERTYEAGGRYVHPIGRFDPYAKLMYGRGVFNYPNGVANLAYNLMAAGAGADYKLSGSINLRAEYEYQQWFSFPLQPLQPNIITVGVAYHIGGSARCATCVRP